MSGILDQILAHKRREVAQVKQKVSLATLQKQVERLSPPRDFTRAVRRESAMPKAIAEIKRASPSAGVIRENVDPIDVATQYASAGAAAISVLTDEYFFGGSLKDLQAVRQHVSVPLLRKDFVLDTYQIWEARVHGADAVLLIAAALSDSELKIFLAEAAQLQLSALVEVHNQEEANRAVACGGYLIGVNHRNLQTFEMDMDLFAKLKPLFPKGTVLVAESGIRTKEDLKRLAQAGADAVLLGEGLMKQPFPGQALRAWLCP